MMANSYMLALPDDPGSLSEIAFPANAANQPSSFSLCLKMLGCRRDVIRRQSAHLRQGLRARLDVGRRARPAHLGGRRQRPDRRARAPSRRASVQPHDAEPPADRARRPLLQGRLQHPRDDRGGRGRGRRRHRQAARLDPRRSTPRHRQAPDRAAHSGVQGRVSRDRRPPAPLRPQARHHRRGPRHGLPARDARGFEPPRPPDRRLPPGARRRARLPRRADRARRPARS